MNLGNRVGIQLDSHNYLGWGGWVEVTQLEIWMARSRTHRAWTWSSVRDKINNYSWAIVFGKFHQLMQWIVKTHTDGKTSELNARPQASKKISSASHYRQVCKVLGRRAEYWWCKARPLPKFTHPKIQPWPCESKCLIESQFVEYKLSFQRQTDWAICGRVPSLSGITQDCLLVNWVCFLTTVWALSGIKETEAL